MNLTSLILLVLIVVGCQNSTNSSNNFPQTPNREKHLTIEDTNWTINTKACNEQPKELLGSERLHFSEGLVTYIYKFSENETEVCYQALAYLRVIQSASFNEKQSLEVSTLIPQQKRTVCKSKNRNETLSDETISVTGSNEILKIDFDELQANAEIKGTPHCPEGILRLKLTKKQ